MRLTVLTVLVSSYWWFHIPSGMSGESQFEEKNPYRVEPRIQPAWIPTPHSVKHAEMLVNEWNENAPGLWWYTLKP